MSQASASRLPKAIVLMPQKTFDRQFSQAQLEQLHSLCDVIGTCPSESLDNLKTHAEAPEVEVLVTGWGTSRISDEILRDFPKLKLIAHCAGTIKNFIDGELLHRGVRITTAATANALPVAEYSLAFILLWNKQVLSWQQLYRQERDQLHKKRRDVHTKIGNVGKTVGIISASRVGRELLRLLEQFDLDTVIYDPFLSAQTAAELGAHKVSLEELMKVSDIVSVNAPSLPETEHLIDATQLARMRDGAMLLNTARGKIIDQDALIKELETGRISAVLDVTDPEPLPANSPLYEMDNVILTPHVAGSLGTEVNRLSQSILSEIELFIDSGNLQNEIGIKDWSSAA